MNRTSPDIRTGLSNQALKPSLAFGAVALCAASSHAQIISTNVDISTTIPDGVLYISFTGSQFLISPTFDGPDFYNAAPQSGGKGGFLNGNGYLITSTILDAGTAVGSGSSWTSNVQVPTGDANLTDKFIGFSIDEGDGNYEYGYAEFSTGDDYNGEGPDVTFTQVAVDTTLNESIITPTATPEPASLALLGLAGGVAAWRRGRKNRTA